MNAYLIHCRAILAAITIGFLATFPALASTGENVGDVFHNIKFKDEAGKSQTLADYRGKVVVLKFWGSWCGVCRQKMPRHQALFNDLKDEAGVAVLTVSFAEPLSKSKAYTDSLDFTLPLYHGSNLGIIKTVDGPPFQPLGTPYNLLIGKDGVIQRKWIGHQSGVTAETIRNLL